MKHEYTFEFKNLLLLPLEREDIEALRVLRNQERQFFSTQSLIDEEQQKKWYEHYLQKDDDIMFKVVKAAERDTFIGAIAVYDIDRAARTAEIGRTLIDKTLAPEKGVGMEATRAICKFAFTVLGISKIHGVVLKSNERIIKVDTRAGFVITGDLDENSYKVEMTPETFCEA